MYNSNIKKDIYQNYPNPYSFENSNFSLVVLDKINRNFITNDFFRHVIVTPDSKAPIDIISNKNNPTNKYSELGRDSTSYPQNYNIHQLPKKLPRTATLILKHRNAPDEPFVIDEFSATSLIEKPLNYLMDSDFIDHYQNSFFKVRIKREKKYVIYQNNILSNLWNIVILLVLFYLALALPVNFAYVNLEEDIWYYYLVNQSANLIFIFDIFLNFFIAQMDEYGNLLDDLDQIWISYFTGWFLIDFLSSIPFELIINYFPEDQQENLDFLTYVKYSKMLRLLKVARMMRIFKIIEQSETYKSFQIEYGNFFNYVLKLLKSTMYLLVSCHFFSLILIVFHNNSQDSGNPSWYEVMNNGGEPIPSDLIDHYDMLVTAWYWAFQTVTTVGYGDVPTASSEEMYFKMFCMILGVIIFSEFLSSISSYMPEENLLDAKSQVEKLKVEMVRKKYQLNGKSCLNLDLLVNKARKQRLIEEWVLIDRLPLNYRNEVMNNVKDTMCNYIPFFREFDLDFFCDIFKRLKLTGYADTEEIIAQDSKIEGFYIVNSGKVSYRDTLLHKYNVLDQGYYRICCQGAFFSLEDCLYNEKSVHNIFAYESCEIFTIRRAHFLKIVDINSLYDRLIEMVLQSLYYLFETKYASLIVLQYLYERSYHIQNFDILNLQVTWSLQLDLKQMEQRRTAKSKSYWWTHIIGNDYNYIIFALATKNAREFIHKSERKIKDKMIKDKIKFSDTFRQYSFCDFYDFGELDFESEQNSISSGVSFNELDEEEDIEHKKKSKSGVVRKTKKDDAKGFLFSRKKNVKKNLAAESKYVKDKAASIYEPLTTDENYQFMSYMNSWCKVFDYLEYCSQFDENDININYMNIPYEDRADSSMGSYNRNGDRDLENLNEVSDESDKSQHEFNINKFYTKNKRRTSFQLDKFSSRKSSKSNNTNTKVNNKSNSKYNSKKNSYRNHRSGSSNTVGAHSFSYKEEQIEGLTINNNSDNEIKNYEDIIEKVDNGIKEEYRSGKVNESIEKEIDSFNGKSNFKINESNNTEVDSFNQTENINPNQSIDKETVPLYDNKKDKIRKYRNNDISFDKIIKSQKNSQNNSALLNNVYSDCIPNENHPNSSLYLDQTQPLIKPIPTVHENNTFTTSNPDPIIESKYIPLNLMKSNQPISSPNHISSDRRVYKELSDDSYSVKNVSSSNPHMNDISLTNNNPSESIVSSSLNNLVTDNDHIDWVQNGNNFSLTASVKARKDDKSNHSIENNVKEYRRVESLLSDNDTFLNDITIKQSETGIDMNKNDRDEKIKDKDYQNEIYIDQKEKFPINLNNNKNSDKINNKYRNYNNQNNISNSEGNQSSSYNNNNYNSYSLGNQSSVNESKISNNNKSYSSGNPKSIISNNSKINSENTQENIHQSNSIQFGYNTTLENTIEKSYHDNTIDTFDNTIENEKIQMKSFSPNQSLNQSGISSQKNSFIEDDREMNENEQSKSRNDMSNSDDNIVDNSNSKDYNNLNRIDEKQENRDYNEKIDSNQSTINNNVNQKSDFSKLSTNEGEAKKDN